MWMFITSNGRRSCAQKSCEKPKKPLPFLTQEKCNCFRSRAGVECQGKYLGAAFKVVNLFLYGIIMRNHAPFVWRYSIILWNNDEEPPAWGKKNLNVTEGKAGVKTRRT